ncbi:LuxR family transcriptional regulator [Actinoplanes sp. KI2]|uniref:response regulator transcription factor n=1 Tax=Actinoplanes sp. KI2 TaxID=2983315 RepID=UPI0021D5E3E9|nr:LuxR family transcriptional regulator [Actinoplanes sp. KI2]MCU7730766.1 LuxR family transcriptional regulator [Actinoplanes sp. KI2]
METSAAKPVPVAICGAQRLFRDVLAATLSARPEFEVIGDVGDPADLLPLCRLRAPELVLCCVDESMGRYLSALAGVRGHCYRARLVLIYRELTSRDVAAARQAGVDTLLPSSHGLDALLRVLAHHHADLTAVLPSGPSAELTDREQDIVALLSAGHPVTRIACLLGLGTRVVENHKRRIYQKLAVSSQGLLAARAVTLGLAGRSAPGLATCPVPGLSAAEGLPELTVREADILCSIARGDTVRQTARSLGIAEKTVENTQARLFRKLNARNRAGALASAHALGLLELLTERVSGPRDARRSLL